MTSTASFCRSMGWKDVNYQWRYAPWRARAPCCLRGGRCSRNARHAMTTHHRRTHVFGSVPCRRFRYPISLPSGCLVRSGYPTSTSNPPTPTSLVSPSTLSSNSLSSHPTRPPSSSTSLSSPSTPSPSLGGARSNQLLPYVGDVLPASYKPYALPKIPLPFRLQPCRSPRTHPG